MIPRTQLRCRYPKLYKTKKSTDFTGLWAASNGAASEGLRVARAGRFNRRLSAWGCQAPWRLIWLCCVVGVLPTVTI